MTGRFGAALALVTAAARRDCRCEDLALARRPAPPRRGVVPAAVAARDLARRAARRPAPARGADDDDDDSEPPSSREATPGDSKLSVATKIKLIVPTGAAGVQRFRVNVKSRQPLPCALDVSAVVAPPQLELYAAEGPDAGRLLSDVDFGSMFYGQAREIKAILVNNAPTACPFVVSVASDRELAVANAKKRLEQQAADEDLGEPKEKGSDDDDDDEDEPKAREVQFRDEWAVDDGALTVTPAEGLLEPRAEQAVAHEASASRYSIAARSSLTSAIRCPSRAPKFISRRPSSIIP